MSRVKVFDIPEAKKIADLSADLVDMDSTLGELTKLILSTDVNKDIKTLLCVIQEKTIKAQPIDEMELPPLMLPANLIRDPKAAAAWLRQMAQQDRQAVEEGKVPDVTERLSHCHIYLDEPVVLKILCTIRDHYQERRVDISKQLHELLNPADNEI